MSICLSFIWDTTRVAFITFSRSSTPSDTSSLAGSCRNGAPFRAAFFDAAVFVFGAPGVFPRVFGLFSPEPLLLPEPRFRGSFGTAFSRVGGGTERSRSPDPRLFNRGGGGGGTGGVVVTTLSYAAASAVGRTPNGTPSATFTNCGTSKVHEVAAGGSTFGEEMGLFSIPHE